MYHIDPNWNSIATFQKVFGHRFIRSLLIHTDFQDVTFDVYVYYSEVYNQSKGLIFKV